MKKEGSSPPGGDNPKQEGGIKQETDDDDEEGQATSSTDIPRPLPPSNSVGCHHQHAPGYGSPAVPHYGFPTPPSIPSPLFQSSHHQHPHQHPEDLATTTTTAYYPSYLSNHPQMHHHQQQQQMFYSSYPPPPMPRSDDIDAPGLCFSDEGKSVIEHPGAVEGPYPRGATLVGPFSGHGGYTGSGGGPGSLFALDYSSWLLQQRN